MKKRLTTQERKIRKSYEKGEWRTLGEKADKRYVTLARRQLKQERVNIRVSAEILSKLRHDAEEAGMPYQTLISSVLYRYARGHLHDDKYLYEAIKILKDVA